MEISRARDFLGSTGDGADRRGWCFVWRDALRHFLAMDQAPNRALQRTATRCAMTFPMIKTLPLRLALAPGGRR